MVYEAAAEKRRLQIRERKKIICCFLPQFFCGNLTIIAIIIILIKQIIIYLIDVHLKIFDFLVNFFMGFAWVLFSILAAF